MKGQEIINHITKEKMPDIEKVREQCINQPARAKVGARRLQLSTAAAVVAALLVFSTGLYAVGNAIYQRFDIGGSVEIVLLPDDDYGRQVFEEWRDGRFTVGNTIYYSRSRQLCADRHVDGVVSRFTVVPGEEQVLNVSTIAPKHTQAIREMLAGKIFTADGNEIDFDIVVPTTPEMIQVSSRLYNNQYFIYDRGMTLYTAEGYSIGLIYLHLSAVFNEQSITSGEPVQIVIRTEAELDYIFSYTYEDAAYIMGQDLRLPTTHVEIFQPPMINVSRIPICDTVYDLGIWVFYNVNEVHLRREWCLQAMTITVERPRDDNRDADTQYQIGGEIKEHDIAGVTVYEIITICSIWGMTEWSRFTWIYDGLVYTLHPSPALTHEKTMDVIRSMIE